MSLTIQDATATAPEAKLTGAILLYASANGAQCAATLHPVVEAEIQPGRPMGKEDLQAIVGALAKAEAVETKRAVPRRNEADLLPETVLHVSLTRLLWWCPSAIHPIYFKANRTRKLLVTHPHLLFDASTKGLRVFALRKHERPTLDTRLCQAPYWNVSADGWLCEGSAGLPRVLTPEAIPAFESAFFDTWFTHANAPRLTTHPKAHDGFWRAMRSKKRRKHPAKWLLPVKTRVVDLLK